jgi:hypothetical protein
MNKQKPAHGEKSLTSNLCLESGMGLVVYNCKEYKEEGKGFTSRTFWFHPCHHHQY